jgi:hypothetical protein
MSIYQREGSANWWLRYRNADGKIVRRSAKTTVKEVALAQLAKAEAVVVEEKAKKGGPPSSTFASALSTGDSLEERVEALETAVRRLLLEKDVQVGILKAWSRSTKRLLSE